MIKTLGGTRGATGAVGTAGATGAAGPTGPTGAAGAAGAAGATGPAGNTMLTTSGAPSNSTGVNGDYANDPTAQLVYGPKAGGVWPSGVSYRGVPGAAGATGATGAAGATGATGPTGAAGTAGAAGATGPAGPVGINGRGAFGSTIVYAVNDAVTFQGSYYKANAANGPATTGSVVGVSDATHNGSGSSFTVAIPSGAAVGDLMLLTLAGAYSVSPTVAGFTSLIDQYYNDGGGRITRDSIWYRTVTAPDLATGTVTIGVVSGQDANSAILQVWRNVGTPYGATAANGNVSPGVIPAGTAAVGDIAVVTMVVRPDNPLTAGPTIGGSGALNQHVGTTSAGQWTPVVFNYAVATSAGTIPTTGTISFTPGAPWTRTASAVFMLPGGTGFDPTKWDVIASKGDPGPSTVTGADVDVATVGKGLRVAEGANAKQGVATLVAGTVTVANTSVTATSRIEVTPQTLGTITRPAAVGVTARTAGTSFVIMSGDATDTSVVAWQMFEVG